MHTNFGSLILLLASLFIFPRKEIQAQYPVHGRIGDILSFDINPAPESTICWQISRLPNSFESPDKGTVSYLESSGASDLRVRWKIAGTYFVSVAEISVMGCSNKKVFPVVIHEIQQEMVYAPVMLKTPLLSIPQAISPNGDGLNDRFVIKGLEEYPGSSLTVFNRQGVKIYTTRDYRNDWDGVPDRRHSGNHRVPSGTYYYVLHPSGTNRYIKGFLFVAE